MHKKFLILIIILSLCLTGCIKQIPAITPQTEVLTNIIQIKNNQIKTSGYSLVTGVQAEDWISKQDLPYKTETGFTCCVIKTNNPIYKVNIATEEDGTFLYRNMEYTIPVNTGDGWIQYQIPGACQDYMIQCYKLE